MTYQLYVNPADPVIASSETPDGDTILLVGTKTLDGVATSADEFHIVNDEGTVYTRLNDNGAIKSVVNSDGSRMEFLWGENYTSVHVSLLLNNVSDQRQILINIDLTKPLNTTSSDLTNQTLLKRNIDLEERQIFRQPGKKHITNRHKYKRTSQPRTQPMNSATFNVLVQTCAEPEPDASVFADVLTQYDEETGTFSESKRYVGKKSIYPGKYQIHIPTSQAAETQDYGDVCDAVEMVLSDACRVYSKINKVVRIFTPIKISTLICNYVVPRIPAFRILPVTKICNAAFKGVDLYCSKLNKKKNFKFVRKTPAQLFCDAVTAYVDTFIEPSSDMKLSFTPYAVFPSGNVVKGEEKTLTFTSSLSSLNLNFTINQVDALTITRFDVTPFDPTPHESYTVSVSYKCYSPQVHATISIIGTDGYRDSRNCYASTGSECMLFVPGAFALVQDVVTIVIDDPVTSTSITRTVTIIF